MYAACSKNVYRQLPNFRYQASCCAYGNAHLDIPAAGMATEALDLKAAKQNLRKELKQRLRELGKDVTLSQCWQHYYVGLS